MQEESQPIIPSSNIALQARNDLLHLAGWVLTAMLCSVAAIATLVFPQFEQTFSAFGADLPTITLLLLRYRFLWWLLPVISLSMPPGECSTRRRIAAWKSAGEIAG